MVDPKSLLLLEDDPNLGLVLQEHLQMQGFKVTLCVDGEQGLASWAKGKFDVGLVDVMMPKKDGFSFVEEIRRHDAETPLIFLTARSMKEDKIRGFQAGCDDYITKPFSVEELMLRIKAVLRRSHGNSQPEETADKFQIGSYTLTFSRQLLSREGKDQKLTPRESELLRFLSQHLNEIVLREEILRTVWQDDSYFAGRSMDVFVSRLRKYLKDDPEVEIIGIHGRGFRLLVGK